MDTQLEKALANYDMIMGRTGSLYDELEPLRDVAFRFQEMMMIYKAAIREVRTKLEVLNDEFQVRSKRNPIRYIKQRVKRPNSILEKLHRRGFEISLDSMIKNLNDIAGIRVVCAYERDIYDIAQMLTKQDDVKLILTKDYIKNPKPNGYRSLHLLIEIPVFFSDRKQFVKVEVQIRTMAMNFWATIEHSLQYKYKENIPEYIQQKLLDASEAIIEVDHEMSDVRDEIMDAQNSHRKKETLVKDILNNIQNLYKVANQREVTKIQDEFYKVYVLDDMLQLKHFARQLDIISEGYRAQSL